MLAVPATASRVPGIGPAQMVSATPAIATTPKLNVISWNMRTCGSKKARISARTDPTTILPVDGRKLLFWLKACSSKSKMSTRGLPAGETAPLPVGRAFRRRKWKSPARSKIRLEVHAEER